MAPRKKVMSEELNGGQIVEDVGRVKWKIVRFIGQGAFGTVYEVEKVDSSDGKTYALKIEPKDNGPLFNENSFFMRCLKQGNINTWKGKNKVAFLGVPIFQGNGILNVNGREHRFLVMSRFYRNINVILEEKKDQFVNFAVQVIDALHYIHDCGYTHGDVKGENLLANEAENEIYLTDFGLASKCYNKETLIPDKKCANDGTPDFCSRDNHLGITSMRGDMETLGFNLWKWYCGQLPWQNVKAVHGKQQAKKDFMDNLDGYAKEFQVPPVIVIYLKEVNKIGHSEKPPYDKLKEILGRLDVSTSNLIAEPATKTKGLKQKAAKAKNTVVPTLDPGTSDINEASRTRGRRIAKVDYTESPEDSPFNSKKPKHAKNQATKLVIRGKTLQENHQDDNLAGPSEVSKKKGLNATVESKVKDNSEYNETEATKGIKVNAKKRKIAIKAKEKPSDEENNDEVPEDNTNAGKAGDDVKVKGKLIEEESIDTIKPKKIMKRGKKESNQEKESDEKNMVYEGTARDQDSESVKNDLNHEVTEEVAKKGKRPIKVKGKTGDHESESSELDMNDHGTDATTNKGNRTVKRKRMVRDDKDSESNKESNPFELRKLTDAITERGKRAVTKSKGKTGNQESLKFTGKDEELNEDDANVKERERNGLYSKMVLAIDKMPTYASSEEDDEGGENKINNETFIVSPTSTGGNNDASNPEYFNDKEDGPLKGAKAKKGIAPISKKVAATKQAWHNANSLPVKTDIISGPSNGVPVEEETEIEDKKILPPKPVRRGKRVAQNVTDEKAGDAPKPVMNAEQERMSKLVESRKKLKKSPNTADEGGEGTSKESPKRALNAEEERILKLREERKKGVRKGKAVAN